MYSSRADILTIDYKRYTESLQSKPALCKASLMKINFNPLYILLAPLLMSAAVLLFILDNLNVNVNPLTSYISKEK
jgi:hypothetical protein